MWPQILVVEPLLQVQAHEIALVGHAVPTPVFGVDRPCPAAIRARVLGFHQILLRNSKLCRVLRLLIRKEDETWIRAVARRLHVQLHIQAAHEGPLHLLVRPPLLLPLLLGLVRHGDGSNLLIPVPDSEAARNLHQQP